MDMQMNLTDSEKDDAHVSEEEKYEFREHIEVEENLF